MTASPRAPSHRALVGARGSHSVLATGLALTAAAAGALAGAASTATVPREATVERRLYLMGTEVTLAVTAGDRPAALVAAERAVVALERSEDRLSTWRPGSELSRLNRAPVGDPVPLSAALADELVAAFACAEATGGAFDPAIGALVHLWDLRGRGRIPALAEVAAALPATRPAALELRRATAIRRHPALRLEEGAWGKGAGLDAALAAVASAPGVTSAELDLGGQAGVLGTTRWTATLADPDERARPVAALELAGGSLATSGNSEHARRVDGRRIGHLLDPRTGAPARDFGSLTVWAPSGLLADCLSTGLFVMGPDTALAWTAAHPGVEAMVLERDGGRLRLRASAGLAGRVRALVPELTMSFGAAPGDLAASRKNEEAAGRTAWQRGPAAP